MLIIILIMLISCAQKISLSDLEEVEKQLGLKIPKDIKDHYIIFNGGFPINDRFLMQGYDTCLLYTSPSPRDKRQSRMPSSA